jgi:hypothetical protein
MSVHIRNGLPGAGGSCGNARADPDVDDFLALSRVGTP